MKPIRFQFLALSIAALLVGCGDDDDDFPSGTPNPNAPRVAPATQAELTDQNKVYTVTVAGQEPIALTFPAAAQYQMIRSGVTEVGTVDSAIRNGNTWTLNITPAGGQQGSEPGTLSLDFSASDSGFWMFTPVGLPPESGTFTVSTSGPGDPDPDPPINPVQGKILQLNYANSLEETFEFPTSSTVSYQEGLHTGTYTYDSAADRVIATLSNGWYFEITLLDNGQAEVLFQETPTSPSVVSSATYTLQ